MFAVLRWRKSRIVVSFLSVLVVAGIVALCTLPRTRASAAPVTVVLDAGHGGYDGGVKGLRTGVKESDINLSIAQYTRAYLSENGYRVVLTREQDRALVETGSLKRRDMDMRLAVIRGANAHLTVSIHCNFYPSAYRRGIQVFYTKDADMPLAAALQTHLNDTLNQPTLERGFAPLWGDYYLLAGAPCPAAIVECGFLSNAEDEALLVNANYRMTLAYQIYCAIDSLSTSN